MNRLLRQLLVLTIFWRLALLETKLLTKFLNLIRLRMDKLLRLLMRTIQFMHRIRKILNVVRLGLQRLLRRLLLLTVLRCLVMVLSKILLLRRLLMLTLP